MTKEQVFELLVFIRNVYPSFDFDQERLDTWHKLLKNQNAAKVMKNAERHALESKFAPSIADIKESHHPAYQSDIVALIKQWEVEASVKK